MRRLLLVILIVMLTVPVIAQDNDDEISPALDGILDQIELETEIFRSLSKQAEVARDFPTRADVIAYVDSQFAEFYTEENIAVDLAFYRAFGLIPADYDLVEEVAALLADQVAGYYDTDTLTMNVILSSGEVPEDDLPFLDRVIYAHEYVHALQDQYFDLDAFLLDGDRSNVDELLARQALVEGDATLVMSTYTQYVVENDPLMALSDLAAQIGSLGNATLPAGTPYVIEQELTFPYFNGQIFVNAVLEDGGWDAVNAMYGEAAPLSSEQILHPQRYLDGDMPLEVTLAENTDVLGDGWQAMTSGVFGEFYLRAYLITGGVARSQVNAGATGWGGDFYHVYLHDDGQMAYEVKIAWDTPEDADEFYNETMLAYGDSVYDVQEMQSVSGSPFCWVGEDALCIAQDGDTVSIAKAPSEDIALALLQTD